MEPTSQIVNPLLGSDPEVFVYAEDFKAIFPVLDLLGGTKKEPKPLAVPGFFVQEDNVLAEYNIPPSKTKEEFVANIHTGLELLEKALPQGFKPIVQSSYRFNQDLLIDPRAMVFGCDPDFNAWTREENEPPDVLSDPTLRSSGGHVILGYDNPHPETNATIVKFFDAYLGIPSVILDRDTNRRKLYGKAGAYRDKDFGVEYRTLSSFWIQNKNYTAWVWNQVMEAVKKFNSGDESIISHDKYIINTINTASVKNAEKFVEAFKIDLP